MTSSSNAPAVDASSLLLDDELGVPVDATLTVPPGTPVAHLAECPLWPAPSSTHTATTTAVVVVAPETCTTRDRATARCLVVGRQVASADVRIAHGSISRKHAVLFYQQQQQPQQQETTATVHQDSNSNITPLHLQLSVMDLGTKYGTTVNDQRLEARTVVALNDGDRIFFGNVQERVFGVKHETASVHIEKEPSQEPSQLTGRDQRQAEIAAIVASLDEKPVYTKYQDDTAAGQDQNAEADQWSTDLETVKLARQHCIPVQHHLRIESESDRPRTTVSCLAVDPAGSRFAVGLTDAALRLYDFGGMHRAHRSAFAAVVPDEGHWPVAATFSPTGDRLLIGTGSAQPVVLDRDGALVIQFVRGDMYVNDQSQTVGHTAAVTAVDWHPFEREMVFTGSRDGSARLWNLQGRTQFDKLVCQSVWTAKNGRGQRTPVTCLAVHPSGRELAVGTACGSVQIFKTDKASARPERAVWDAHGTAKLVSSLAYNRDGTQLLTRSSEDTVLHLWNAARLSRSSRPVLSCTQAPTLSEHANAVVCRNMVCATVSEMVAGTSRGGRLNFYQIYGVAEGGTVAPLVSIALPQANINPTVVQWHVKLEQIFVGCSNGDTIIFYGDGEDDDVPSSTTAKPKSKATKGRSSKKGAAVVANRAGRTIDPLTELLQSKAPTGSAAITGEILTPLTQPRHHHKRKREQEEAAAAAIEPERPAIHKHKTGSQAGGTLNFQQFVADQTMGKRKEIAGKDPREELFKYNNADAAVVDKAYEGTVRSLAKTKADEDAESSSRGKK